MLVLLAMSLTDNDTVAFSIIPLTENDRIILIKRAEILSFEILRLEFIHASVYKIILFYMICE